MAKSKAAGPPLFQHGKKTSAGRLVLVPLVSSGLGGSKPLFSSSGRKAARAAKEALLLRVRLRRRTRSGPAMQRRQW